METKGHGVLSEHYPWTCTRRESTGGITQSKVDAHGAKACDDWLIACLCTPLVHAQGHFSASVKKSLICTSDQSEGMLYKEMLCSLRT